MPHRKNPSVPPPAPAKRGPNGNGDTPRRYNVAPGPVIRQRAERTSSEEAERMARIGDRDTWQNFTMQTELAPLHAAMLDVAASQWGITSRAELMREILIPAVLLMLRIPEIDWDEFYPKTPSPASRASIRQYAQYVYNELESKYGGFYEPLLKEYEEALTKRLGRPLNGDETEMLRYARRAQGKAAPKAPGRSGTHAIDLPSHLHVSRKKSTG